MSEPISKVQRWLDLIAYLAGRRLPVSVEELMEQLPAYARDWMEGDDTTRASVRRKFERDKDELRDTGIPIETVTYHVGALKEQVEGYRLTRTNFYLPYLKLLGTDEGERGEGRISPAEVFEVAREEAAAAVRGLRHVADVPAFPMAREARSAFRKLTFDLDPATLGMTSVLFAEPPESAHLPETLRVLSDAVLRRKRVTFLYRAIYRDEVSDRSVLPYGLLFQHSHWYLVGFDENRDDIRIFRVGRMTDARSNPATPNTPDFQVPEDFTLRDYAKREAWELGEDEAPARARVRFHFPLSLWAERNGRGTLTESLEDGSSVREFEIRNADPFLRWILSLQGEAGIVEPPELAKQLVEMARAVAELYSGDRDDG